MSKIVYILGAGASISHSNNCPLITQFFSTAASFDLQGFDALVRYARFHFGIGNLLSTSDETNVEELLTNIEIEIERSPSAENIGARDDLLRLIQRVLIRITPNKGPSDYDNLINQLQSSDSIITFNWDLLLDDLLPKGSASQYSNSTSELTGFGEMLVEGLGPRAPYKSMDTLKGYYLKLHGSIDWLTCDTPGCRFFGKSFPIHPPDKVHWCGECHERMGRLIVPPTLNKGINSSPTIRRIWTVADKQLLAASDIVIWGYSLPATDFYSAWLLRRPLAPDSISLVNPQVEYREFVARFTKLFAGCLPREGIKGFKYFANYLTGDSL